MMENDFLTNENKQTQPRKSKLTVLFYRWLFLVFASIFLVAGPHGNIPAFIVYETIAVVAIYNAAVTAYAMKHRERVDKISTVIIYLDIVILSLFVYFSGGIHSEVYILLFFLIGYCGIFNNALYTIKVGLFSGVLYSIACVFAAKTGFEDLNYLSLVVKGLLFVLGAYGISRVNHEVKRYDELRKKEFKLARTDKLTGLANRHYFDQKLLEEASYADESGGVLNILLFDLDNFKRFNDTYGHPAGDKLLVLFSDIIKQNIRKSDIPVRFGGEEFLILIRDLDVYIAKSVGDRIRRQLEKQRIYVGEDLDKRRVTVSCGVAQYPGHSTSIKQVIEMADKALYHAKEVGKNVVVTYDEIGKPRAAADDM